MNFNKSELTNTQEETIALHFQTTNKLSQNKSIILLHTFAQLSVNQNVFFRQCHRSTCSAVSLLLNNFSALNQLDTVLQSDDKLRSIISSRDQLGSLHLHGWADSSLQSLSNSASVHFDSVLQSNNQLRKATWRLTAFYGEITASSALQTKLHWCLVLVAGEILVKVKNLCSFYSINTHTIT